MRFRRRCQPLRGKGGDAVGAVTRLERSLGWGCGAAEAGTRLGRRLGWSGSLAVCRWRGMTPASHGMDSHPATGAAEPTAGVYSVVLATGSGPGQRWLAAAVMSSSEIQ